MVFTDIFATQKIQQ